MDPIQRRRCAYCCQEKPWIWNGARLKDGSKIYVDETSARWAGRRCAECERRRVKTALKFDSFRRSLVLEQLEREGYRVKSKNIPIMVEKNHRTFTVGVQFVAADGSKLTVDQEFSEDCDLYALIFESVRILDAPSLNTLRPNIALHPELEQQRPN